MRGAGQWMMGYPAKRLQRLRKCEQQLRQRSAGGAGETDLVRAAERVREAQILMLKGMRHFLEATWAEGMIHGRRLKKIQNETLAWEARSVEEIIGMYR